MNWRPPFLAQAGRFSRFELTGFEAAEIDALMGDLVDPEQNPADQLPELGQQPVSQLGDLWQLGRHRLLCADAREPLSMRDLMGPERAIMVFTDPPYNVRISSVQGRGKIRHREFLHGSGEMSPEEFTRFLVDSLSLAAKYSVDGSIHYVCTDWRHLDEINRARKEVYSELKNLVVWNKTNSGQGTFYRSQHELIFVFKHGHAPHINNFGLGQYGRNRSNIWTYAGVNTFRAGRLDDLSIHPTVKPVALIADAMRDCSRRGDIVLDPFMGSGTRDCCRRARRATWVRSRARPCLCRCLCSPLAGVHQARRNPEEHRSDLRRNRGKWSHREPLARGNHETFIRAAAELAAEANLTRRC